MSNERELAQINARIATITAKIAELKADCADIETIQNPSDEVMAICKQIKRQTENRELRLQMLNDRKAQLENPTDPVDQAVVVNNPSKADVLRKYAPPQ